MPTGAPVTSPFMPSISTEALAQAEFWLYRIGGYLLINVLDDPDWLALMFC